MLNREHFEPVPKAQSRRLNVLPQNPEASMPDAAVGLGRFPSWLHRKLPKGNNLAQTGKIVGENRLHTVCEEARCPNLLECWSKKTATFLAMGKACTRNCGFCDIDFSREPASLDPDEPSRIADSVKKLGLRHVVITMVARDDLPDGGAAHLAKIITRIREEVSDATIEVLTSDLSGNENSLMTVLEAGPEIFNHNVETVRRLTPRVRHKATYERSLELLKRASTYAQGRGMKVKSGLMLGLGETVDEVEEALRDLHAIGCHIVTMGQYLQPNPKKLLVKAFVHPDQFKQYELYGLSIGIPYMYCGPFVRSSYNADLVIRKVNGEAATINSI